MTKFCYIEIRHQGSAGLASQPGFYVDESPLSKWKKQAIFKKNTVQINHINNDKLLSLMEWKVSERPISAENVEAKLKIQEWFWIKKKMLGEILMA